MLPFVGVLLGRVSVGGDANQGLDKLHAFFRVGDAFQLVRQHFVFKRNLAGLS